RGVHFGADHEDVLERPGADVGVGDRQSVDEARALLPDIQTWDVLEPERTLNEYARPREVEVRRQRRKDDEVDVSRGEPGALERLPAGGRRECRSGLTLRDPVPLLDSG